MEQQINVSHSLTQINRLKISPSTDSPFHPPNTYAFFSCSPNYLLCVICHLSSKSVVSLGSFSFLCPYSSSCMSASLAHQKEITCWENDDQTSHGHRRPESSSTGWPGRNTKEEQATDSSPQDCQGPGDCTPCPVGLSQERHSCPEEVVPGASSRRKLRVPWQRKTAKGFRFRDSRSEPFTFAYECVHII